MMEKQYPLVAREGWWLLSLLSLAAAVAIWYVGVMALPLLFLVIGMGFVLRDPARKVPAQPLAIVSPVDGILLSVTEGKDPFLQRPSLVLQLQKSVLGVFSIRSPLEGKIQQQWFQSDTRLHASWVQTDEGDNVVWAVEAAGWRRKPCRNQTGERVGQGQRCGFQWFSGKVSVYLPTAARSTLKAGDRIVAGETVIASLVHNTAPPNLTVEKHRQEAERL